MSVRVAGAAALAVAGAITLACTGIVDPSKNVTDNISGTVAVQGFSSNPFSTSKNGEFTVKITSLTPSSGSFFGVMVALRPAGASCTGSYQLIQRNDFATVNTVAITGPIYPGDYCVYVYDNGAFTTPESYTGTVSRP